MGKPVMAQPVMATAVPATPVGAPPAAAPPFQPADASHEPMMATVNEAAPTSFAKRGKRKSSMMGPIVVGVLGLATVVGGFAIWKFVINAPVLVIRPLQAKAIDEMAEFKFKVPVDLKSITADSLEFALENAPPGLQVDVKTGEIVWKPTEEQGPQDYKFFVLVSAQGHEGLRDKKPFALSVKEVEQPPVIAPLEGLTAKIVDGEVVFTCKIDATDQDVPPKPLKYSALKGSPPGTKVNAETGELEWRSKGQKGNTDVEFIVAASKGNSKTVYGKHTFKVHIEAEDGSAQVLAELFRKEGSSVEIFDAPKDDNLGVKGQSVKVGSEEFLVYEFPTPAAMNVSAAKIGPDASTDLGRLKPWSAPTRLYRKGRMIVLYLGDAAQIVGPLTNYMGEPFAIAKMEAPTKFTLKTEIATAPDAATLGDDKILELFKDKKLFDVKEYVTLRGIYANRFEKMFESQIKQAFGTDYDAMMTFLNQHKDLKEEFFTAIDPVNDKVVPCLTLFKDLYKQFPKQFVPYGNLAIAVSVTWDDQRGIYKYQQHQQRTHSIMPSEQVEDGIASFKYILDCEEVMQGRGQYIPWELLTLMVNHTTPVVERQWALQNLLPFRQVIGRIYSTVPYDTEMLRTSSRVCKLADKPYTLPNILQFGGVCAMQADYAARVGKSLGVPAAYVTGQAASGDLHAWVMWVDLKTVTESSIVFSLESHGRYFNDHYYVGTLEDPHTGKKITDRELELRLNSVCVDPIAKRHADLIMRSYPMLREKDSMDVARQLYFLAAVMQKSPGNEQCWFDLAKISKSGEAKKPQKKELAAALDQLFRQFTNFPDFTWKVFDDLISFQDENKQKIPLYERLLQLYESAERPDLACEGLLKLSDYLVTEKKSNDAIEALAFFVKKYPKEGRFIPKTVDKIEAICKTAGGADAQLVQFYQEFLPMIPQMRGNEPSKYCMDMYDRAIKRFTELRQPELAQLYTAQLAALRARAPQ